MKTLTVTIPCEYSYPGAEVYFEFEKVPKQLRGHRQRLTIAENVDGERWSANLRKLTCKADNLWRLTVRYKIAEILTGREL